MAKEITWHVEPIIVIELTGYLGAVECAYKAGIYRIEVYRDQLVASLDGRTIPLNHSPVALQRSANSLRDQIPAIMPANA